MRKEKQLYETPVSEYLPVVIETSILSIGEASGSDLDDPVDFDPWPNN